MARTIKGGLYRTWNGNWVNASGEKVADSVVRDFFKARGEPVPEEVAEAPKPKPAAKKTATKKTATKKK